MRTKIKTIHEEEYSDNSRTLGVLHNYSIDDDWYDTLFYIYSKSAYIFFNTIMDKMSYQLTGEKDMKRAYLREDKFDEYYDSEFINGSFREQLEWS